MAEEEFTEYEVRTASNDVRTYYTSKFKNLNDLKLINSPSEVDFVPPFFVKFDEIVNPLHQEAKDSDSLEPVETTGFKRVRRWRHKKEFEWKLFDNKKSETCRYTGRKVASTLPYVALIPPSSIGGTFKMVKIKDVVNFERNKNKQSLSLEQIEKLQSKKAKFGSSMLEAVIRQQQSESKGWIRVDKSRKSKNAFEVDEDVVESSLKTDVGSLAIDRIAADKAGESFADFDDNFSDDEDDAAEIKQMTAQVEEDIDPVSGEEDSAREEEEEPDLDKLEGAEDKNYESDEEVRANNTKGGAEQMMSTPPPELTEENKEKKNVRMKFTESLINTVQGPTNKRKKDTVEAPPSKKQKILGELETNLISILKNAGGKMLTKNLVREAKNAKLIGEKDKFKAALAEVGALETVDGQKMVVLKTEYVT